MSQRLYDLLEQEEMNLLAKLQGLYAFMRASNMPVGTLQQRPIYDKAKKRSNQVLAALALLESGTGREITEKLRELYPVNDRLGDRLLRNVMSNVNTLVAEKKVLVTRGRTGKGKIYELTPIGMNILHRFLSSEK